MGARAMDDTEFTPTIPRRHISEISTTARRWAVPEREGDDCTVQGVHEKTGKPYTLRMKAIMGELGPRRDLRTPRLMAPDS